MDTPRPQVATDLGPVARHVARWRGLDLESLDAEDDPAYACAKLAELAEDDPAYACAKLMELAAAQEREAAARTVARGWRRRRRDRD